MKKLTPESRHHKCPRKKSPRPAIPRTHCTFLFTLGPLARSPALLMQNTEHLNQIRTQTRLENMTSKRRLGRNARSCGAG